MVATVVALGLTNETSTTADGSVTAAPTPVVYTEAAFTTMRRLRVDTVVLITSANAHHGTPPAPPPLTTKSTFPPDDQREYGRVRGTDVGDGGMGHSVVEIDIADRSSDTAPTTSVFVDELVAASRSDPIHSIGHGYTLNAEEQERLTTPRTAPSVIRGM